MTKDGRVAEARTRILPHADGRLDLIIYVSRSDGTFTLLWSQTLAGGEVNELALRTQREYEMRGWTLDTDAVARDAIDAPLPS